MKGRSQETVRVMDAVDAPCPERRPPSAAKPLARLRPLMLVFPAVLACMEPALAQSREDEEYCFNSSEQKILMVAGGKDASLDDWPFIGALRQRPDFNAEVAKCGGTFLSPTWFLTAGHCVATTKGPMAATLDQTNTPRFAVSQLLDQRSREVDKTAVAVKRIELAPGFAMGERNNMEFADHDIALLKLSRPFNFAVRNVYLPMLLTARLEKTWVKRDRCASIAGWGSIEEGRFANINAPAEAATLQAMNVMVWDDADCADSRYWPTKQAYHFCAGFKALRKNSCHGDSGGPLVIRDFPTGFALVGVLSAGPARSCPGDKPNLYTRVSAHEEWIKQTMSNDPR
jgi:secreted trypsin-like serine protease